MSTAFALALLTTSGVMLTYSKLPRKVRRFIEKHSLLADIVTLVAVYLLLGGTLTALMAAAMCGIFVSILLHVVNNKENFWYLWDLKDFIKERMKTAKVALDVYGATYRKRQEEAKLPATA